MASRCRRLNQVKIRDRQRAAREYRTARLEGRKTARALSRLLPSSASRHCPSWLPCPPPPPPVGTPRCRPPRSSTSGPRSARRLRGFTRPHPGRRWEERAGPRYDGGRRQVEGMMGRAPGWRCMDVPLRVVLPGQGRGARRRGPPDPWLRGDAPGLRPRSRARVDPPGACPVSHRREVRAARPLHREEIRPGEWRRRVPLGLPRGRHPWCGADGGRPASRARSSARTARATCTRSRVE